MRERRKPKKKDVPTAPIIPTIAPHISQASKKALDPSEVIRFDKEWKASPVKNGRTVADWNGGLYQNTTRYDSVYEIARPPGNNVRILMHGTPITNGAAIILRGFKLPTEAGMFGTGLYFTDTLDKAINFAMRGSKVGLIFRAMVSLGKEWLMEESRKSLDASQVKAAGFDSVHGKAGHTKTYPVQNIFTGEKEIKTLNFNEWAVYHRDQVRIVQCDVWVHKPKRT